MTRDKTPKRRFIAGAVCPSCGVLDRMVVEICLDEVGDEQRVRVCVGCSFSEPAPSTPAALPRGRPERRRPDVAVGVQVLKLAPEMRPPPGADGDD